MAGPLRRNHMHSHAQRSSINQRTVGSAGSRHSERLSCGPCRSPASTTAERIKRGSEGWRYLPRCVGRRVDQQAHLLHCGGIGGMNIPAALQKEPRWRWRVWSAGNLPSDPRSHQHSSRTRASALALLYSWSQTPEGSLTPSREGEIPAPWPPAQAEGASEWIEAT